MQRIAERLECGVASIYRVFSSKDLLIAELQQQSLDELDHRGATAWPTRAKTDGRGEGRGDAVTGVLLKTRPGEWQRARSSTSPHRMPGRAHLLPRRGAGR